MSDHNSVTRSALHQAALDYAAKGWPVFPCLPGLKKPATEHGFHEATTDERQIDAWWAANPDLNIAFCPHEVGLAVVDLDGDDGLSNWAMLELEHGAPDTFEVTTPRGGKHLYYRGELPPSVAKLAGHVDTRGKGSYALLPPSRAAGGGEYRVTVDRATAALPTWILPALGKKREAAKASIESLDLPGNVERATRYLLTCRAGRQGEGCDALAYETACHVLNLGVSSERAIDLMVEHWGPRCEPCDERMPDFIERKVTNAASYAQNEAGAWAVEPAGKVFAGSAALDKLLAESAASGPARGSKFKRWTFAEMAALPEPTFLMPNWLPEHGVSLLYGPGGSYKSFIAMRWGLDIAKAGKRVLLIAGEGGIGPYKRALAWAAVNEAGLDDLEFEVVRAMPWASDGQMMVEFIEAQKEFRPDLVIVDTVARMAVGLNENDAKDMGLLVAALDALRDGLACTVLAIHHTGKDTSRGARGSDALLYATDAAFEVKADPDVMAVAVHCRRQKDIEIPKLPLCYEGKQVADSLNFQPISFGTYRALTQVEDALAPKKVGAALMEMGIKGEENGVSTHVLASHLLASDDVPPDQMQDAAGRVARVLSTKARGNLEAYCSGQGSGLRWFLPV